MLDSTLFLTRSKNQTLETKAKRYEAAEEEKKKLQQQIKEDQMTYKMGEKQNVQLIRQLQNQLKMGGGASVPSLATPTPSHPEHGITTASPRAAGMPISHPQLLIV